MNKLNIVKLAFLIFTSTLITSCYENYLVINSEFKSAEINSDSTNIFFFHILQAGQPAKGISKFPDGGTQNTVYKNVSLYSLNIENKKLIKIIDFGDLPYGSWNYHISVENNTLIFSICPIAGWNWTMNKSNNSLFISLYDKHRGFYKYDIKNNDLKRFIYDGYNHEISPDENQIAYLKRDSISIELWYFKIAENSNDLIQKFESSTSYFPMYWKDNENVAFKENDSYHQVNFVTGKLEKIEKDLFLFQKSFPIKKIQKLTEQKSFKDWGFDLSEYWPQNKKQYINDIVVLKGNLNFRKAILQNISDDLSKDEIKDILTQMKKYGEALNGLEKTEYQIYSQETIDLLNQYLN